MNSVYKFPSHVKDSSITYIYIYIYIDGLVQWICNYIINALELRHLALTHRYDECLNRAQQCILWMGPPMLDKILDVV